PELNVVAPHLPGPASSPAPLETEARRLLWRCRRGMKELDVMLERFAHHALPDACPRERQALDELLSLPDAALEAYLVGEGNPAEAEDIAQEAFIKAYRALPQFRGDSAFYTWLYRIAINTAKNAVVSRDRSPIEYELDRSNEESYDMQSRMKDAETPEGLVLTDEIRSTVNAAIDALPEDLRTAIVLRELEGLSY